MADQDLLDRELELLLDEVIPPTYAEKIFAPGVLKKIAKLRQNGLSKQAICTRIGIPRPISRKLAKQFPIVADALEGIDPPKDIDPESIREQVRNRPFDDPCTAENLTKIQKWAKDGVSVRAIATLLDFSEDKFLGFIRSTPRVASALARGLAEREALACEALTALMSDPAHKDHIRAVLAALDKTKERAADQQAGEEQSATPEQIMERLGHK